MHYTGSLYERAILMGVLYNRVRNRTGSNGLMAQILQMVTWKPLNLTLG